MKDPTNCTTTEDQYGKFTVVFTWDNGDQKTFYNIGAAIVDQYETSGAGVEEFYYSLT